MKRLRLDHYALSCCVVAAMLAGCGGSPPPIGAPGAMASVFARHVRMASGSGNCPALPGGTGILPDGDLSQAADPPNLGYDDKKGIVFAPDWEVSKRTIDFMGTTSWDGDGVDGYCSVDLDGWHAGAITSAAFSTTTGASYTLSFVFSGNDGSPPTIKTMKVSIDHQFTTYTWDTSGGYSIENGDYTTENGTLYGTTYDGGANGDGTVFAITPSGKGTVLHNFGGSGDGESPLAGLLNVNGTLYGTTDWGGANGNGTVFAITTSGTETVLHSFAARAAPTRRRAVGGPPQRQRYALRHDDLWGKKRRRFCVRRAKTRYCRQ
ncbi:MAG: choice-of-anchor tandem repeat GloVer-containing protein [Candidatus Cybelea sp.]|jgi:uncharacterized repeat protein (TIGR03803 family)